MLMRVSTMLVAKFFVRFSNLVFIVYGVRLGAVVSELG
jgi:hypothetical protein